VSRARVQARVQAYRRGVLAESLVALLLRLKGYRVLARRYRTPVGEIDLVALRGRRLAFVEVKRRKTAQDAAWTVPARQRRRIMRAAQYWLAGHPGFGGYELGFDVVLTAPLVWPRFIEDAFTV
jgi:putative endonuclease